MAAHGSGNGDDAKEQYTTDHNYHGEAFQQKRTPASKLRGKGGPQVTALEQLLDGRYAALQADDKALFITPEWDADYATALAAVTAARPTWSVAPYDNEAEFYRLLNDRRQRAQKAAATQPAPAIIPVEAAEK